MSQRAQTLSACIILDCVFLYEAQLLLAPSEMALGEAMNVQESSNLVKEPPRELKFGLLAYFWIVFGSTQSRCH